MLHCTAIEGPSRIVMTIPNLLTLFRLLLIPIFLVLYYLPVFWAHYAAAFVFWLAAITDWLDGYLARKLQQSTPFGAFLDPVADKVMVTAALLLITEHYQSLWVTIPALIMVSREIVISALREWMAEIGKRSAVAVSWVGKVKTTAQMLALIGLVSGWYPFVILGWPLLYIAVVLTVWSMVTYLAAAWKDLLASS